MRLSRPNVEYDIVSETNRNFSLEQADRANFKKFEDIDLANNERLILVSPNGTRYSVTVDNSGNLGTTAI
jgi:hypothetical protein